MGCGGNPEAEADALYKEGKYRQAISRYLAVKKSGKESPLLAEKIGLSYFHKGRNLYKKTKNVKSFSANFVKSQEYIDTDNLSDAAKKEYSFLLYELAKAYHTTQPSNEIQEKQYFDYTLNYMDEALFYDFENTEAENLLMQIKADNFQKMFDKGKQFYDKAQKEKNHSDLFLTAEYYLNKAVSFNPEADKAKKYLSKTRKRTLSIPDFDWLFPFAIGNKQYSGKSLFIAFTGFNNANDFYEFDPKKLVLIDLDENEYKIDLEKTGKFANGLTQKIRLKSGQRFDGDIAFNISKKVKIKGLAYHYSNNKTLLKYFP
jgi:hypothetical protein